MDINIFPIGYIPYWLIDPSPAATAVAAEHNKGSKTAIKHIKYSKHASMAQQATPTYITYAYMYTRICAIYISYRRII